MSKRALNKKVLLKRTAGAVMVFSLMAGTFMLGSGGNVAFAQSDSSAALTKNVASGAQMYEAAGAINSEALIPEVRNLKDQKLQQMVDRTVKEKTINAIVQANTEMKKIKEEWLKAGNKQEEMLPQAIFVNYEVKKLSDDLLSFVVIKAQTQANYYEELTFYNFDLKAGKELNLKDALSKTLGNDAIEKTNARIRAEIEKRSQAEGAMFFDGSEGVEGFQGITDGQKFYINEQGNPVIVFNKYEIAPGFMGIQEFEITK